MRNLARTIVAGCLVVMAAACAPGDPAGETVRRIIEELSARQFGTAVARYTQQEELVLSPAAAPEWRRGLEHEDATVREWSVDSLARIGEAEDIPRVVSALDDPFRNVQEAAARSLIVVDEQVAYEAFIERLASDDPLKQALAAQALADLGNPAAAPEVLSRFNDTGVDDSVRIILAQSLGALGDPQAVPSLARVAADAGADVPLRRGAVEALAVFETPEATVALEGLLASDDSYVQEIARLAIAGRR